MRQDTNFHMLFAFPKPIDELLAELIAALEIKQQELAEAASLNKAGLSRVINGKSKPSNTSLGKLHTALTQEFGLPVDLLTIDYLIACRDIDASDKLSPRITNLNDWLNNQPPDVQQHFWTIIEGYISTVEALND